MVHCDFLIVPDGFIVGFLIEGHSGAGSKGNDVVCAAVSSAAYLTVNTITDVLNVVPLVLRVRDGEMYLRLSEVDEPACRDLLKGLRLHLTALEEEYPQNLRVAYSEV